MQSFAKLTEDLRSRLERLGGAVTSYVVRLGFASRFLAYMFMHSGPEFSGRRLQQA